MPSIGPPICRQQVGGCTRLGSEGPLLVPGWGVEAVLKNTEYSAMDEVGVGRRAVRWRGLSATALASPCSSAVQELSRPQAGQLPAPCSTGLLRV
jgi:hypothetical protein